MAQESGLFHATSNPTPPSAWVEYLSRHTLIHDSDLFFLCRARGVTGVLVVFTPIKCLRRPANQISTPGLTHLESGAKQSRGVSCPRWSQLTKKKYKRSRATLHSIPRHHHPFLPHTQTSRETKVPYHDAVRENIGGPPLLCFNCPCHARSSCQKGRLGSQYSRSKLDHRVARWGNVQRYLGSRQETCECIEPLGDNLSFKGRCY